MTSPIVLDALVQLNRPTLDAAPFTTSEIIAKYAEVQRHAVQQLIVKYREDLEEFGVLAFQMQKPPKGSKGGRPVKNWQLNERQATLLITYLDNTAPVRAFKKALVNQFYSANSELQRRRALRELERPMRRTLTDSLKAWPYCSRWSYKTFTDLLCRLTTGKTTGQLKRERGTDQKAAAADLLTSDELTAYQAAENKAVVLIDLGMTYEQIKAALTGQAVQITLP